MADEFIGKNLDRYHLVERLGEGGMAVVYKAFDATLERNVAIKVILPYREHSEEFLERFRREAFALARLSHPNILKIFDYGEHEGQPYLVMEYISGGTLKEWMTSHAVPWQRSAQLVACIARALEAAHAEGIIHRDVKPANILMTKGGDPLLSDFGIAKLIQESTETSDLTGTGVGIGTPSYMAPEQMLGKVDERSDIYALGVIFYEMVTGKLPYKADTPVAALLKKNADALPRPSQYVSGLPESVENILIKALALEPQYRYQTMAAFARALEKLGSTVDPLQTSTTELSPEQPTGETEQAPEAPVVPARKKFLGPLVWGTAVVILLLACSAGLLRSGAAIWPMIFPASSPTTTSLPSSTPEQRIVPTLPESSPTIPASTPVEPLFTPTAIGGGGEWIAFNSRINGSADIYLMDIDGNHRTQLISEGAHDIYPSWSPDGKQIVYQTNQDGNQDIAIFDLATRKITQLTRNTCNDWGPVWSPAGDWIAFYSDCDGERNVYKMRTDGSRRTQLTFTGAYSWWPSWSPDGKKITFSSNRSGKYHIYVMSADGANVKELAAGCISYFSPDGEQILYGQYCDDTGSIFLMDANGSHQDTLIGGYECKNATWSPDGTQIVFQLSKTTKEGPFALYRTQLDKPDRSDWILLADYDVNGGSPVWQP
jgi:serine/threonine protein kinase